MACVWTRSASEIIASSIPFSFVVSLSLLWLSPCGGYTGGNCTTRCSIFSPFRLFSISLTCLLHSFAVFPFFMSFVPAIMMIVVLVFCSGCRFLLHVVVSSRVGIHVCVILVCSFLSRWGWILWLFESPMIWTFFLGSSGCLFLFVCCSAYFCLSALSWCSSTLILVALSSATSWSVRLSFSSALLSFSSWRVFFLSFSSCVSVSSSCLSVFCSCLSVFISCSSLSCSWLSVLLIWFLSSVALFSDVSLCSVISSCSLLFMSFSALFSVVALWFSSVRRLFSCSFCLRVSDWSWYLFLTASASFCDFSSSFRSFFMSSFKVWFWLFRWEIVLLSFGVWRCLSVVDFFLADL